MFCVLTVDYMVYSSIYVMCTCTLDQLEYVHISYSPHCFNNIWNSQYAYFILLFNTITNIYNYFVIGSMFSKGIGHRKVFAHLVMHTEYMMYNCICYFHFWLCTIPCLCSETSLWNPTLSPILCLFSAISLKMVWQIMPQTLCVYKITAKFWLTGSEILRENELSSDFCDKNPIQK